MEHLCRKAVENAIASSFLAKAIAFVTVSITESQYGEKATNYSRYLVELCVYLLNAQ